MSTNRRVGVGVGAGLLVALAVTVVVSPASGNRKTVIWAAKGVRVVGFAAAAAAVALARIVVP